MRVVVVVVVEAALVARPALAGAAVAASEASVQARQQVTGRTGLAVVVAVARQTPGLHLRAAQAATVCA
jgi:hypothetical protein